MLKERRDELQLRLVETKHAIRTSALLEAKDEGDRATAAMANEMSSIERAQADNLLTAVNAALDRIDAGTFGECRTCHQEIGLKRLEAIPWTRYCITCQELLDER